MQEREHGKWVGYYANECQTDVRQSAQVCGILDELCPHPRRGTALLRVDARVRRPEDERRIMLILNTEPHPAMTTSGC